MWYVNVNINILLVYKPENRELSYEKIDMEYIDHLSKQLEKLYSL